MPSSLVRDRYVVCLTDSNMILVSLEHMMEPYLHPDTNMVDALLYRGRGLDVDTVIVDGEVLPRNRWFTRLDKENITARLKEFLEVPLRPHGVPRDDLGRGLVPQRAALF